MAELTPEIVDLVVAACQAGATHAAQAIGRCWARMSAFRSARPRRFGLMLCPAEWRGPGLAVVLKIGTAAMILVIPESGGLVPAWCRPARRDRPEQTGHAGSRVGRDARAGEPFG